MSRKSVSFCTEVKKKTRERKKEKKDLKLLKFRFALHANANVSSSSSINQPNDQLINLYVFLVQLGVTLPPLFMIYKRTV